MRRIYVVMAVLAATLGAAAQEAPALSAGETCHFVGATGMISPSVKLVGGAGQFTFAGQAECTDETTPESGPIYAQGTFTNLICGTGTADGTVTTPGRSNRLFHLRVDGGDGIIYTNKDKTAAELAQEDPHDVSGHVSLIPTGPANTSAGECVAQFTVVGTIRQE